MTIGVFIDNNVWDFLFDRGIDIDAALPPDEFQLGITPEAEFEIAPLEKRRPDLKAYIEATIARRSIRPDFYFGFAGEGHSVRGFGFGRFASPAEQEFRVQQLAKKPADRSKNPKTGLLKDEADIALGARAFQTVVLSLDKKPGPLKKAYEQGAKVVFLTDFDESGISLRDFIRTRMTRS